MRRIAPLARQAFTMVELLVAMALMVTLASIALVVVPDVMNQDRTTDAAGTVRQWLTIAKSRAARDQQPRGVRFIVATDPNNPAKTNPLWVTELQYTEAQPYLDLSTPENSTTTIPVTLNFLCAYDANGSMIYGQIPGTGTGPANPAVFSPQCIISNISAPSALQIQTGCLLTVTPLGTSHRVLSIASSTINLPPSTALSTVTVVLDSFPQAQLGAAGAPATTNPPKLQPIYSTTLFGITAPPQPLVGEPPLPLPRNICVDLTASTSGSTSLSTLQNASPQPDVDIVFLPSGQVAPTWLPITVGGQTTFLTIGSTGQIFLWVRDYTKNGGLGTGLVQNPNGTQSTNLSFFQQGGEQQIVSLKTKSGATGVFPVSWPDFTGTYASGLDPYTFARQGSTNP